MTKRKQLACTRCAVVSFISNSQALAGFAKVFVLIVTFTIDSQEIQQIDCKVRKKFVRTHSNFASIHN